MQENKSLIITGVLITVFIFGIFGLMLIKPNRETVSNKVVNAPVERPVSAHNFSEMNMETKIPVFKANERFHFNIQREIILKGNIENATIAIKIPEDVPNRQKLFDIKISPAPKKIVEKPDGKYAYIDIAKTQGGTTVSISGDAMVRTYNLEVAKKLNKKIDDDLIGEDKDFYLGEEEGIETNNDLLKDVANKHIQTATNTSDTVKNIFDFTANNLVYDKTELKQDKGAVEAWKSKSGVCEEFSKLFVALCRIKGIPARVVIGFRLPFQDEIKNSYIGHAWAEVYIPEYGWVTFDPTNELSDDIKNKAQELGITPYDLLTGISKYSRYLIADVRLVTVKYEGSGNIISKNLRASFDQ